MEVLSVVVLSGGISDEREISLNSGRAVAEALSSRGHQVAVVDPAFVDLCAFDWSSTDVCFIALHGELGEDGQIQSFLESIGLPYTGSGPEASELAFSKSAAKNVFTACGVPTPDFETIHQTDSAKRINDCALRVGYPLVVKPDAQGSSLGISIVNSAEELAYGLAKAFSYGESILLEEVIPGTEWTVPVIGCDALPLIQIESSDEFYTFDAKYNDGRTDFRLDFSDDGRILDGIRQAGIDACLALKTDGVARVDLRVDRYQRPWVLEVNTIPGFTDHSLVPKAAQKSGSNFADLCETCLKMALERSPRSFGAVVGITGTVRL